MGVAESSAALLAAKTRQLESGIAKAEKWLADLAGKIETAVPLDPEATGDECENLVFARRGSKWQFFYEEKLGADFLSWRETKLLNKIKIACAIPRLIQKLSDDLSKGIADASEAIDTITGLFGK